MKARFGVIFDPDNQGQCLAPSPVSPNVPISLSAAAARASSTGLQRRLSDRQWIRILVTDSNCDRLTEKEPADWEQLLCRLGVSTTFNCIETENVYICIYTYIYFVQINTARSGLEIMQEFYSTVAPRLRQPAFGLMGKEVIMGLQLTHPYAMTVVYHAVDEWSFAGIRSATEDLVKSRILDWKMQKPNEFWSNLFWQKLYSKNATYFCTDEADFAAFKTSVFGTLLPNVVDSTM